MLTVCPDCGTPRPGETCPHCQGRGSGSPSRIAGAAAVALLGLSMASCTGVGEEPVALYGMPVTDEDGDGYMTPDDCDDFDDSVHPGATETAGDGVDSNCDGQDDPVDDTDSSS